MLKKTIFFVLFFLNTAIPAMASPGAWRVEGANGALIVFGTMHRLPEGADWLSDDLTKALKSSRLLVLETVRTEVSDDYLGYLLRQPGVAVDDKPLKSRLEEDEYAAFLERIAPHGYREEDVANYRPWFAVTLLGMLGGDQVGLEFGLGAEETLRKMAAREGIDAIGLESVGQQTHFYSDLPKKVEIAWLKKILNRNSPPGARSQKLFNYWIEGDLMAIGDQVLGSYSDIPELYEVFIKDRNETWAEQLEFLLEEGGQVFVAVGAAHMAGEDSVLNYLEERGFQITRIQ